MSINSNISSCNHLFSASRRDKSDNLSFKESSKREYAVLKDFNLYFEKLCLYDRRSVILKEFKDMKLNANKLFKNAFSVTNTSKISLVLNDKCSPNVLNLNHSHYKLCESNSRKLNNSSSIGEHYNKLFRSNDDNSYNAGYDDCFDDAAYTTSSNHNQTQTRTQARIQARTQAQTQARTQAQTQAQTQARTQTKSSSSQPPRCNYSFRFSVSENSQIDQLKDHHFDDFYPLRKKFCTISSFFRDRLPYPSDLDYCESNFNMEYSKNPSNFYSYNQCRSMKVLSNSHNCQYSQSNFHTLDNGYSNPSYLDSTRQHDNVSRMPMNHHSNVLSQHQHHHRYIKSSEDIGSSNIQDLCCFLLKYLNKCHECNGINYNYSELNKIKYQDCQQLKKIIKKYFFSIIENNTNLDYLNNPLDDINNKLCCCDCITSKTTHHQHNKIGNDIEAEAYFNSIASNDLSFLSHNCCHAMNKDYSYVKLFPKGRRQLFLGQSKHNILDKVLNYPHNTIHHKYGHTTKNQDHDSNHDHENHFNDHDSIHPSDLKFPSQLITKNTQLKTHGISSDISGTVLNLIQKSIDQRYSFQNPIFWNQFPLLLPYNNLN